MSLNAYRLIVQSACSNFAEQEHRRFLEYQQSLSDSHGQFLELPPNSFAQHPEVLPLPLDVLTQIYPQQIDRICLEFNEFVKTVLEGDSNAASAGLFIRRRLLQIIKKGNADVASRDKAAKLFIFDQMTKSFDQIGRKIMTRVKEDLQIDDQLPVCLRPIEDQAQNILTPQGIREGIRSTALIIAINAGNIT